MTIAEQQFHGPVSSVDPFDHDNLEDPVPFHTALREAGEVLYLERYDLYAMGRYEQVHAALIDWQTFQSGAGVGLSNFRFEKPWRPPSLLLETDPPRHDAPRVVLEKILSPRAIRGLHDEWAADADELVDQVVSEDRFDAMTALAQAFPLRVFPDAVGIGQAGRENLLPYGDHLFNAFGPANDLVTGGNPHVQRLSGWVNEQCARDALTDSGFGAKIWAAADHGDITETQAPLIVRSLLSAGVDTTVHGVAALLYAIATNPEQWQQLRAQPQLARIAFDEAVRWESPVQTFFRTATRDVRIGSVTVPDGKKILMFLGSANRDPRRWSQPDTFDLTRDPSGHVGFGMGIHQCVGQHIARLEASTLIAALARRVKTIELDGEPRRHHNNTLRAWASLPMQITRT